MQEGGQLAAFASSGWIRAQPWGIRPLDAPAHIQRLHIIIATEPEGLAERRVEAEITRRA